MDAGFADRPDTGFTVYYDALPAETLDALRALMKTGRPSSPSMAHEAPSPACRASLDAEFAISMHSSGAVSAGRMGERARHRARAGQCFFGFFFFLFFGNFIADGWLDRPANPSSWSTLSARGRSRRAAGDAGF